MEVGVEGVVEVVEEEVVEVVKVVVMREFVIFVANQGIRSGIVQILSVEGVGRRDTRGRVVQELIV